MPAKKPKQFHHDKTMSVMVRQNQFSFWQRIATSNGDYVSTWARKIIERHVTNLLRDNPNLEAELAEQFPEVSEK